MVTKQEFLDKARSKHGYKYQYPNLKDKILSTDIIDISYNGCVYKQRVVKHILLGRCPEKNTPAKTQEGFLLECQKVWGNKYDYSLTEYKGALKRIKVIYDGVVFEQIAVQHIKGRSPEEKLNTDFFLKKSNDKWGNKYDYSFVDFKNGQTKVKIIYNGDIYFQTPNQHLKCAPENIKLAVRKTTEQFIKDANIIHNFKYDYKKSKYEKNQIKLIITCPVHGDFNQTPNSHLQGVGCPSCNESKGEKEIAKFLDNKSIKYHRQYKFPDCRNKSELPFDFYIPSMRTAIEFDGMQHYEPRQFFGGIDTFNQLQINDKIKTDYCEENFINLIRIKYDQMDRIWEILWENLKVFIKK